jgi:DNA-3-methyladenine glycosylase
MTEFASVTLKFVPRNKSTYSEDFFARPTVEVARGLLGAVLCRRLPDKTVLRASIVEVEAYTQEDPACHAFNGKTNRCGVMFGQPGRAYVYFIYGMYFCLNVVTEPEGRPGAILIRALAADGTNGPGKLCREWQIDRQHNGINLLTAKSDLWIEQGEPVDPGLIMVSTRIGISSGQDKPWRFYVKGHPCVSGLRKRKLASAVADAVNER